MTKIANDRNRAEDNRLRSLPYFVINPSKGNLVKVMSLMLSLELKFLVCHYWRSMPLLDKRTPMHGKNNPLVAGGHECLLMLRKKMANMI